LIKVVAQINAEICSLAAPSEKKTSVGGMITKIQAAKMAVDSGIACVIANGKTDKIIKQIVAEPLTAGSWTVFLPKKGLAERERWIAFGTKPKGRIIIDDGAKKALLNNKSLLSVGIIGTENNFDCGCVVSVMDKCGNEFARGMVSFSSKKIEEVKGKHFDKEIIHRNDTVIL
jgi:glutamate 5-kinase